MAKEPDNNDKNALLEAALKYVERGWSVFPVTFENGKKKGAFRWKRYQTKAADVQRVRRWFKDGRYPALGVILGPVSGDLACRDFDEKNAYYAWTVDFPDLAKTLPTVETARGFHVYFTAKADKTTHYTDGELRGARSLCVLPPSPHPDGIHQYRWIVPLPDGIPPKADPEVSGLVGSRAEQSIRSIPSIPSIPSNQSIPIARGLQGHVQKAILRTLPNKPGQRNTQIFRFARALKAIPGLADCGAEAMRPYVDQWYSQALQFIATKTFPDTWYDFQVAWLNVHTPLGSNPLAEALEAAKANPIPDFPYTEEKFRLLVAWCREMQARTLEADQTFWISVRDAEEHLGISKSTASTWLRLLELEGWIKTVEKGGTAKNHRKATRFRYIGDDRAKAAQEKNAENN